MMGAQAAESRLILTEFQNFSEFRHAMILRSTMPIPLLSDSLNLGSFPSTVIGKIREFCPLAFPRSRKMVPLCLPYRAGLSLA